MSGDQETQIRIATDNLTEIAELNVRLRHRYDENEHTNIITGPSEMEEARVNLWEGLTPQYETYNSINSELPDNIDEKTIYSFAADRGALPLQIGRYDIDPMLSSRQRDQIGMSLGNLDDNPKKKQMALHFDLNRKRSPYTQFARLGDLWVEHYRIEDRPENRSFNAIEYAPIDSSIRMDQLWANARHTKSNTET